MEHASTRRTLCKTAALALGAACLTSQPISGAPSRRLKIGHTSITWGFRPEDAEPGIKDSASLGYHGYESLGEVLDAWEAKGGLGRVLEEHKIPLPSAYCTVNLTDPTRRKDEIDAVVRRGKLIRKLGGSIAPLGPNGVKRAAFDFKASKSDIVAALNEICKALSDIGVVGAVHQHTNTCIQTQEEVYSVFDSVDTRYVKFGPDVAQLAAGGADPVKVLKDLLPLVRAVHLKDYNGGPHWAGYCPLGQGKVDIPAVVDLIERSKELEYLMVELDPSRNPPMTPFETARTSKEYLQKLGYQFRA